MRALLFLLASVALAVGCKKADPKPDTNPVPAPPGPVPPNVQPKSPGGVDFKLTAEELFNQATKASDKFVGKVIEVSGNLETFAVYPNGVAQLQLSTAAKGANKDPFSIPIRCAMVEAEPWATVLPGQRATITGTFAADFDGLQITLTGCRLVSVGEFVGINESPKEMLKAATANPSEAVKKYTNKWMRVTGDVTELRPDVLGTRVVMKVDGATVDFVPLDRFVGAYKVGAKATAVGQVLSIDPNYVRLMLAFPVTQKK